MSAATELELCLHLPAEAQAPLRAAWQQAGAQVQMLRATYVDTADGRLAAAHMALRVRREGRAWVQTLKAPLPGAGGVLARAEHEVRLPAGVPKDAQGTPLADATRHAGTDAGAALAGALGSEAAAAALVPWLCTEVRRARVTREVDGSVLELALDLGTLRAQGRTLAVREVEIEHKGGAVAPLFEAAGHWVRAHGAWLEVRHKNRRGALLAAGEAAIEPVHASAPALTPAQPVAEAWPCVLAACLAQALPNAAQIASGAHAPEHIHQLRVALRRLRAAVKLFEGLVPALPAHATEPLWQLARDLGATRDDDVLREALAPQLAAAGAPPLDWPAAHGGPDPASCVRAEAVNLAWLALLAATHAPPVPEDAEPVRAAALTARLDGWRRALRRQARRADGMDDAARHALRKRFKRLRYGLDLCAGLLPERAHARRIKALARVQAALGDDQDATTAHARLRALTAHDARAWFAVGWLAARRPVLAARSVQALADWVRSDKGRLG